MLVDTCVMARPLRWEYAGALYPVTARGDRREAIFRPSPWERVGRQVLLADEAFMARHREPNDQADDPQREVAKAPRGSVVLELAAYPER